MKILKRLGIGILVVIILIVLVSFFLPSKVHIERSLEMKAKPATAFSFIYDLKKWSEWSPWYNIDTATEYIFSQNTEGVGAWYTWKSDNPKVREGKLTIIESNPYSYINTQMDFGMMGIPNSAFKLDSVENGVKVTWSLDSKGKGIPWYFYVLSKYLNLMMDKKLGASFEKGLTNLKSVCEAVPQKETVAGFDVEEKMVSALTVLSIREKVKMEEIGRKIGQNYALIGQYMLKNKINVSSSPLIVIHSMEGPEQEIEFVIPVDTVIAGKGNIVSGELAGTNAIVVKYLGAYNRIGPVYEAAYSYMAMKGKKPSGPPREVYITDPGIEKDTTKWLTEIVFPVE